MCVRVSAIGYKMAMCYAVCCLSGSSASSRGRESKGRIDGDNSKPRVRRSRGGRAKFGGKNDDLERRNPTNRASSLPTIKDFNRRISYHGR